MNKPLAHLLLFLAVFLWGINFVSMKYLINVFPPLSMIFIRFLLAAVFLWTVLFIKRRRTAAMKRLQKSDYKSILITSSYGIVIYFYFQLFAFNYLSANMASLICALIPIFSIPAEALYYKKKSHPLTYILSAISLYGVYMVLNMSPQEALASNVIWGIALMIISILCWVLYTLTIDGLQEKYDTLSMLTYQSTVAAVLFAFSAMGDMTDSIRVLLYHDDALIIICNLLFLGIGSSALAYLFYINGMKNVGVQLSSLYMNFIPIITAITSYLLYETSMNARQLLGMLLVVSAIVLINKLDALMKRENGSFEVINE